MATDADIRKALEPMKNRTPSSTGDAPLKAFNVAKKKKGLTSAGALESLFGKGSDFANQSGEFQANLRKTQATSSKAQSAAPKAAPKAQSAVLGVASVPALKPPKLAVQKVAAPKKRVTTGRRRAFGGRGGLSALRSKSLRERNL